MKIKTWFKQLFSKKSKIVTEDKENDLQSKSMERYKDWAETMKSTPWTEKDETEWKEMITYTNSEIDKKNKGKEYKEIFTEKGMGLI